jgi:hypothetical protein
MIAYGAFYLSARFIPPIQIRFNRGYVAVFAYHAAHGIWMVVKLSMQIIIKELDSPKQLLLYTARH